jgi:hypothetical protein
LKAIIDKNWSTLFQVRQNLQKMQDVWLPAAKNLTDSQKHQLNGDAYFLLIGITSAENVHQISSLNQTDTIIGVDTLKQKFFDPLIKCANIFWMPRDSTITALLASMLLRLSGNSQVVAYFYREW